MNNKDYSKTPLRVLVQYFRPHRGLFVLDLSCALVMALIDLAFSACGQKRNEPASACKTV